MTREYIGQGLISVCYVGLLLVFAYTSTFYEVIVVGKKCFLTVYNLSQASVYNFFVNIGLLLLLLVDYCYDKEFVPRWTLSFSVLAFGLLVGVHYLALKVERVASYQMPFNWPWLGLVIFLVFVLI